MEKKFIKTDRWICREDANGEVQLRLISDETVMYANLNIEEMKMLRDFLIKEIERCETQKVEGK